MIGLGCDRVLTSGRPWRGVVSDDERLARLAALLRQAAGRLEIVLAGGLCATTARNLLEQLPTGNARLSLHAWSGVRRGGRTRRDLVQDLVQAAWIR